MSIRRFQIFAAVLLLLPGVSLAAADDVTLERGTTLIIVGDYSLIVTATNATLESLTVDTSSFSVTLQSGSSISVISQEGRRLTIDPRSGSFTSTFWCEAGPSQLSITATGSVTITITPEATTCTGGGIYSPSGGAGSASPVISTSSVAITAPASSSPAAFTAAPSSAQLGESFSRNLSAGMIGDDVRRLQIFLNTHGFVVVKSGPGSPGKETSKFGAATWAALVRYQKANKITPASGFLGPMTRAKIASQL